MATPKQVALIEELLDELGWDRDDISAYIGEEYQDYEDLDVDSASELISGLIDQKREMEREERGW